MAALDDNLRKVPPQNLEAESSALGGILLENDAINIVVELLRPEDFYRESHRKIFRAMIELTDRSEPVDLITLTAQRTTGEFNSEEAPISDPRSQGKLVIQTDRADPIAESFRKPLPIPEQKN